ncbi:MAG TPA: cyanophycinase [Kiloniellaceae bacterium]|nr:cyanophycinase [Kiloniellaceae bacterium]
MRRNSIVFAFCAALLPAMAQAGTLIPIGGGLAPDNEAIYRAIIAEAGTEPHICVFGTASSKPAENGGYMVEDFQKYGARAEYVDITEENFETTNKSAAALDAVARCTGFFFIGGDQRRITKAILGSPVHDAMKARFADGAVVAGTSAGAAMMSEIMINGGRSIDSLTGGDDPVATEPGLGFADNVIIDQHFLKYGRLGRLLQVSAETGTRLAIGVDEDTALVMTDDGPWQVIGESSVVFLQIPETAKPGAISDVRLSILSNQDSYDPAAGGFSIHEGREDTAKVGYYNEAGPITSTDIFGKDAVLDIVTYLSDSPEVEATGFAFLGSADKDFKSDGVRLTFTKAEDTSGFWGKGAGGARYSVVNMRVAVEPIEVSVSSQ